MIAGRYTLEREVGRGGMGAVWLGLDEVLGRRVALKRVGMAPGGSTPDLGRAEREARLAARLNHPHVVAVYDLVTEGDEQWLVMEYVEGTTLAALVKDEGPLSPDQAALVIGQVADALAAAHTAGIVHRDVKPSNILVSPDGQVKLSDFGIARAEADASLTQTGLVTGSPAYLSPEVATGRSATDASDVWSIGATLYHALAGHPPYEVGDNVLGALYRIVHEDPPRLVGAGWLAPLLGVTMAREPADRWPMDRVRDFLMAGPQATVPAPARTTVPPPAPKVPRAEAPTHVLPMPPVAPQATSAPPISSPVGPANDRRRGSLPAVLAAALAVVAIAVVGWVAFRTGAGDDDQPATGSASHSGGPGKSPSSSSSGAPAARAATADGMRTFVEDYLATVTTDPAAAWQRLTPGFQAASGNFGQYQRFWNGIRSAEVVSAQADPSSRQVSYTVDYVHRDGTRTSDDVTLVLEGTDGDYRISGES